MPPKPPAAPVAPAAANTCQAIGTMRTDMPVAGAPAANAPAGGPITSQITGPFGVPVVTPIAPQILPPALPAAERARLGNGWRVDIACAHGSVVWHYWAPTAAAASRTPLVLMHGGSGSWTHWVRNISALQAAGRHVWAVDLPGFGDSDPPAASHDAEALVTPLAQSMAALFGGVPVDVAGFSFGGLVAGLLLAAHPALARQLVLVGAPGMGVQGAASFTLKGWRHLGAPALQEAAHRHNLATLMLHRPERIDALALQLHTANVQRDRMLRRRRARPSTLAEHLPRVPCPVSAIYGEHDVLYAPHFDALAHAFATAAPRFCGLHCVADAGHWVQYEQPEAFHSALAQALGQSREYS